VLPKSTLSQACDNDYSVVNHGEDLHPVVPELPASPPDKVLGTLNGRLAKAYVTCEGLCIGGINNLQIGDPETLQASSSLSN
jgi:hypothetical protein